MDGSDSPLLGHRGKKGKTGCQRIVTIIALLFLSVAFLYAMIISILSPILWVKYNTSIAQNSLDASIIAFDTITLRDPTANTLTMDADVTISQAGQFAATMQEATVSVLYKGKKFGSMVLPQRDLNGDNIPTSFTQTSTLTVTDFSTFQETAYTMLQGETVQWRLSGDVTLSVKMGFSLDFALHLEKDVQMVGKKLSGAKASNVRVFAGLPNQLVVLQDQYIFNPSNIAMKDMGNMTFEVYVQDLDTHPSQKFKKRFRATGNSMGWAPPPPPAGTIKVAEVFIPSFTAPIGPYVTYNTTSTATMTRNNTKSLENFLSLWNMGVDQTVRLRGPIKNSLGATFLYGIVDIEATIEGSHHKIIQGARFNGDDPENPINPVQTACNPLDLDVHQNDFKFNVFLAGSFLGKEGFSVGYENTQAPNTDPFFYCAARPTYGNLTLQDPAGVTIGAHKCRNISVTIDPNFLDKCDSWRIVASCCGLYSGALAAGNGKNPMTNTTEQSFLIGTRGTMTTTIGNFTFTQTFEQVGFNLTCGSNTDFFNQLCYPTPDPPTPPLTWNYCLQSKYEMCNVNF